VTDATPADLQRALAHEFERRGWEYDMAVGTDIVQEVERRGAVDPPVLAQQLSGTWLEQNRTTRDDVAGAIARAFGGLTPTRGAPSDVALSIDNRSYTLRMESGSQITSSQVNVGGTQINIQPGVSKDEILAGVRALLQAGLGGDWNPEAAADLAATIEARDDIGFEDIEALAVEIAETASEPPDEGRVRSMLSSITEQGVGGALATGISAGLGWLIRNPPT